MTSSSRSASHIIIVNYNAGDWLVKALESALSYSDSVVSVVDNASTDDSIEDAQSLLSDINGFDRINWLLNSENLGFAAANNQILSTLEQDYAVLMNPDCELHQNSLSTIISEFNAYPTMGLASCRIVNSDGSLQASCRRRFPTPWSALVRMLYLNRLFPNNPRFKDFDYGDSVDEAGNLEFVEAVSGAFMVVKKEAMHKVGLLDEGYFMHCEDLDWCKRFELSGWKVGFIQKVAVSHAKGVSSRSRPVRVLWTLHRGMDRFFDKFYRTQYNWLVYLVVKAGIYLSFLGRAFLAIVRGGNK